MRGYGLSSCFIVFCFLKVRIFCLFCLWSVFVFSLALGKTQVLAAVYTVSYKVTGKCGLVTVRIVPAPRGASIVATRVPRKVLQFAGIEDVFTSSRGSTKTLENFVKATFECLLKTCGFLTPDFWRETRFTKSPFQYTNSLAKPTTKIAYIDDSAPERTVA